MKPVVFRALFISASWLRQSMQGDSDCALL